MLRRHALVALLAVVTACDGAVTILPSDATVASSTTSSSDPTTSTSSTTTSTVPTFQVTGSVTDEAGSPVIGATVASADVATTTGPDGWFAFETMTPGPITVSKAGWSTLELEWGDEFLEVKLQPLTIRGLRVGAGAAADDEIFSSLLAIARDTAVNAFVFDTKQEGGAVMYQTTVPAAHEIGAVKPTYDPALRLGQTSEAGIYAITRIVTFEDALRAKAFPDEKLAGPWLDPRSPSARQYALDLAVEACEIGFDEIQFDYIRYPSGSTAALTGQLDMTQEERVSAIAGFLAEARSALHPMGCAVSADVFGIVVSVGNDQGLGQRPEELSAEIDALSPMVYPSHYSDGWIGFSDPNDHPYDVTADAITDALPRMAPGSTLRPWLQAFWWTDEQIRRSIQAAEDHGVGWILWNVRSNFDIDALPTDAEVAP